MAFELAFQWDDGVFVAPFVATADESVRDITAIATAFIAAVRHQRQDHCFVDLGCGDGRVVIDVCDAFRRQTPRCSTTTMIADTSTATTSPATTTTVADSTSSGQNIPASTLRGFGVELDEDLVDECRRRLAIAAAATKTQISEPTTPAVECGTSAIAEGPLPPLECVFKALDLRDCNAALMAARPTILFTYMLPEGVATVLEPFILKQATAHWGATSTSTTSTTTREGQPDKKRGEAPCCEAPPCQPSPASAPPLPSESSFASVQCVLSNRWTVPLLEAYFVERVGETSVYMVPSVVPVYREERRRQAASQSDLTTLTQQRREEKGMSE